MKFDFDDYRRRLKDVAEKGKEAAQKAREICLNARRCKAVTAAGTPCKSFAIKNHSDHLCISHLRKAGGSKPPPDEARPTPAGKRTPGKRRKRNINALLKRFGLMAATIEGWQGLKKTRGKTPKRSTF
jgi:hypothetical protein